MRSDVFREMIDKFILKNACKWQEATLPDDFTFYSTANVSLAGWPFTLATVAPVIYLTDFTSSWDILRSLFVVANTIVRIQYPSCYCPASGARPGLLYNPLFARFLATFAEFAFYELEAEWLGVPFWYSFFGNLTTVGEMMCWAHIYFQSELLGWIEDCIWTTYQAVAAYFLYPNKSMIVPAPFAICMVSFHLPRMFKRIEKPYYSEWMGVDVKEPDDDTKAWVLPSLVLKPLVYAIFMYNTSGKLK